MKISIALATYNGDEYLEEQLQSFLKQTRLPDELVVSDDCSNDTTIKILEQFKYKAPFEVLILKNDKNLGYIKNFARTISKTTGDIIFLSDQDDYWFKNKIGMICSVYTDNPIIDLIINDVDITDKNLISTNKTYMQQHVKAGGREDKITTGCATSFKRRIKSLILPIPDNLMPHDAWIHRIADSLNTRLVYKEALQYYRRHGKNVSNAWYSEPNAINIINLLQEYRGSFDSKKRSISYEKES